MMTRQTFLRTVAGGISASVLATAATDKGRAKTVKLAQFDEAGVRKGVEVVEKISKTDEEWQKQLSPEQFEVTRRKGTERAFTGKYARITTRGRPLPLHLLQYRAFRFKDQIRIGYRLAEFLPANRQRKRERHIGFDFRNGSNRSRVRALRGPPRARVYRWPPSNGIALLYELSLAEVCAA